MSIAWALIIDKENIKHALRTNILLSVYIFYHLLNIEVKSYLLKNNAE